MSEGQLFDAPVDPPWLADDTVWIGEAAAASHLFMALAEVGIFPVHERGGYLIFDGEVDDETRAMVARAVEICTGQRP